MLVWMAFQYQAALRESFAALNEELVDGWQERIRALLNDAKSSGEISETVDSDIEAGALWAYSSGIGQLGVLHPESFPPARQKALVEPYPSTVCGPIANLFVSEGQASDLIAIDVKKRIGDQISLTQCIRECLAPLVEGDSHIGLGGVFELVKGKVHYRGYFNLAD